MYTEPTLEQASNESTVSQTTSNEPTPESEPNQENVLSLAQANEPLSQEAKERTLHSNITSSLPERTQAKVEAEEDPVAEVNGNSCIKENAWPADVHIIGKDIVR
jgi:hypothetical protein